eukprot:9918094-Alexandrium_andersonii.AAC.1
MTASPPAAAEARATLVSATTRSALCLWAAPRCQSMVTWPKASIMQHRAASSSARSAGRPPALPR